LNNSKFGFHKGDNTEVWKYFKATAKEYFFAEYGRNTIMKGEYEETIKVFTGIDRIDDYWLIQEFRKYIEGDGRNYDRLVSFMAALFTAKVYQQNRMVKRRSEVKPKEKEQREHRSRGVYMLGGSMVSTSNIKKPFSLL
jgi:hypothetical protein